MNESKRSLKEFLFGKTSKLGLVAAAVTAIIVAIVIVFNLIVGQLPRNILQFDISSNDLYTVSDLSKQYLKTLETDVEIIVLSEGNKTDERILKFLYNYAALSGHITLKEIDPIMYPSILETYETTSDTVVVRSADTGKMTLIDLYGFDGTDMAMLLYDYNYYSRYGEFYASSFDAEGQITSAIGYVTGETTDTVYLLSGHGEAPLSASASSLIEKSNIAQSSVDLLLDGGIPEDCSLLLCYNPASDLADDELELLLTYMRKGGKMMLIIDSYELKNFNTLLATYGLEMQTGFVGDQSRYYSNYASYYGFFCFAPTISADNSITSGINTNAIFLYGRGLLEVTPERRKSSVTPFMTTTEDGVVYIDETTYESGTYILGATAVESINATEGIVSRLTVISSAGFIDEQITSTFANMSNLSIFLNAVLANFDGISGVSIGAKSLSIPQNTLPNANLWMLVFIVFIPIIIVAIGLVYWTKRRKR